MEFKLKTEAELKEMTAEERDTYSQEKRQHELNQAVEASKTAALDAVQKSLAEVRKSFDDSSLKNAELSKEAREQLIKSQELSERFELLKSEIETSVQGKVDASIKGLEKMNQKTIENKGIETQFKQRLEEKGYKPTEDDCTIPLEKKGKLGEQFKLETKAFETLDVHTVTDVPNTVYPDNGTVSAVGDTLRTWYAQFVGFFTKPRPYSKIMDRVRIQPLIGHDLLAINQTYTGDFEITPECTLKPVVKMELKPQKAEAKLQSAIWYTSLHMRVKFGAVLQSFRNFLSQLLNEKIPNHVLDEIKALASPITLDPSLAIDTTPNNLDALISVLAQLENEGYVPDTFALNPIAYANMRKQKANDGHYMLENRGSIQLLSNGIEWGGEMITLTKDPELGVDEFLIGDMANSVIVGLDSQVYYFETDGRTDGEATTKTGLGINVRTHELAQFIAVMIPNETAGGVVLGTFTDVKTQITA